MGAWGVKGWIKVQPFSLDPQALFATKRWFLQAPPDAAPGLRAAVSASSCLKVIQAKDHGDMVVASAQDLEGRDAAQALRGARVFVSRASFPTADDGEYYWVDLIGLAVVNREGAALGQVTDLLSTGPQTVLVVGYEEEGKARERMIPFVAAYVDGVDLPGKRITVDWQADY